MAFCIYPLCWERPLYLLAFKPVCKHTGHESTETVTSSYSQLFCIVLKIEVSKQTSVFTWTLRLRHNLGQASLAIANIKISKLSITKGSDAFNHDKQKS